MIVHILFIVSLSPSYFMVLSSGGLSLFSQSLQFESVHHCRSFGMRYDSGIPSSYAEDHLMGSYFSALEIYTSVLQTKMTSFDLGFDGFKIEGIVEAELFFIGIFDTSTISSRISNLDKLHRVKDAFLSKYKENLGDRLVDYSIFENFTDYLLNLYQIGIDKERVRNCLTNCTKQHQGCIPHYFYFEANNNIQTNSVELDLYDHSKNTN